jgi:hypothetical protein
MICEPLSAMLGAFWIPGRLGRMPPFLPRIGLLMRHFEAVSGGVIGGSDDRFTRPWAFSRARDMDVMRAPDATERHRQEPVLHIERQREPPVRCRPREVRLSVGDRHKALSYIAFTAVLMTETPYTSYARVRGSGQF